MGIIHPVLENQVHLSYPVYSPARVSNNNMGNARRRYLLAGLCGRLGVGGEDVECKYTEQITEDLQRHCSAINHIYSTEHSALAHHILNKYKTQLFHSLHIPLWVSKICGQVRGMMTVILKRLIIITDIDSQPRYQEQKKKPRSMEFIRWGEWTQPDGQWTSSCHHHHHRHRSSSWNALAASASTVSGWRCNSNKSSMSAWLRGGGKSRWTSTSSSSMLELASASVSVGWIITWK